MSLPTSSKQLEWALSHPGWDGKLVEGKTLIGGHPSCRFAMLYLGWGDGCWVTPPKGKCQLSS